MAIVYDPTIAALNTYLLNEQARAEAPALTASNTQQTAMDSASLAALQALIQSLSGQQAASMANKQGTVNQAKVGAEGYSKEAAFADSQAVMQAQMANALKAVLPNLVRASEGAGTSQSSMMALLQQQAASDAANQAAALGLKSAVDYGQIATGLLNASTQAGSTADPTTAALLSALTTAKGTQTSTKQVQLQGKDPDITSISGVMGGANRPVELNNNVGQIGRFGNPYSKFSF